MPMLTLILFSVLYPFWLGYLLVRIVGKDLSGKLVAAMAYPTGMSMIAFGLLFLGWANIHLIYIFPLSAIGLVILTFFHRKKTLKRSKATKNNAWTFPEILAGVFIFLVCAYGFWRALAVPVYAYDSLAIEAFKAKVFFYTGSLSKLSGIVHPSLPLQASFNMLWTNLCLGRWDDRLLHLPSAVLFTSLILLSYEVLKDLTERKWALLGTALLSSSPILAVHAGIAYRDIWMLYANAASIGLICLWRKNPTATELLTLSALWAGAGTFIKLEGQPYMVAAWMAVGLSLQEIPVHSKMKIFLRYCAISTLFALTYIAFKSLHNLQLNEKAVILLPTSMLGQSLHILYRFLSEMFLTANWNILYAAFPVLWVTANRQTRKDPLIRLLVLVFLAYLSVHFMTAMFSVSSKDLLHKFTLSRIFLHFWFLTAWGSALLMAGSYRTQTPKA